MFKTKILLNSRKNLQFMQNQTFTTSTSHKKFKTNNFRQKILPLVDPEFAFSRVGPLWGFQWVGPRGKLEHRGTARATRGLLRRNEQPTHHREKSSIDHCTSEAGIHPDPGYASATEPFRLCSSIATPLPSHSLQKRLPCAVATALFRCPIILSNLSRMPGYGPGALEQGRPSHSGFIHHDDISPLHWKRICKCYGFWGHKQNAVAIYLYKFGYCGGI